MIGKFGEKGGKFVFKLIENRHIFYAMLVFDVALVCFFCRHSIQNKINRLFGRDCCSQNKNMFEGIGKLKYVYLEKKCGDNNKKEKEPRPKMSCV